jgi:hypothetical protein
MASACAWAAAIALMVCSIRTGMLLLARLQAAFARVISMIVVDKCPRCHGSGKIDIYPGGGFDLNPGNRPSGTVTCPVCGGSGVIKAKK